MAKQSGPWCSPRIQSKAPLPPGGTGFSGGTARSNQTPTDLHPSTRAIPQNGQIVTEAQGSRGHAEKRSDCLASVSGPRSSRRADTTPLEKQAAQFVITPPNSKVARMAVPVSYTHLRAHETPEHLVCRLLLEKKKKKKYTNNNFRRKK
eukprot:TRINITY_DN1420_c0_g1_i4.p1 TRINITY_DN1420_c0_g1~~TRINITY_DN1420_c0_g1_i4.p1  ORF type:complete len:149 (+),score=22.38 TRINITY_DN1420_c0_g1_i4:280-726(+)